MPTRNVSLTAEQDAFVERVVKAGEYQMRVRRYVMPCACFSKSGAKTRLS